MRIEAKTSLGQSFLTLWEIYSERVELELNTLMPCAERVRKLKKRSEWAKAQFIKAEAVKC